MEATSPASTHQINQTALAAKSPCCVQFLVVASCSRLNGFDYLIVTYAHQVETSFAIGSLLLFVQKDRNQG
jgi:hypothetical protein